MKQQLLAALALFPMIAGAADLAPGTLEVAGTTALGFSSVSSDSERNGSTDTVDATALGGITSVLYYLAPNIGVGLSGGYGYTKAESATMTSKTSSLSFGPAVSFQVPVAPQLALFGRGHLDLIRGSSTVTRSGVPSSSTVKATFDGHQLGLQAGLKYFPIPAVSFDAGLAWTRHRLEDDSSPSATETTTNLGVNVGVSVYFGGAAR